MKVYYVAYLFDFPSLYSSFSTANKVTVSDASLTADPYTLFYYILSLRGTLFKERKCFLLADMGAVSKFGDAAVSQFISTITNADLFEWFIVLAPSSGVGWKHNTTSADENFVRELMRTFRIRFHHFQLTNLTSTEALYYIRMIGAAREGEEKSAWDEHLSAATKGNPLLLRCYEGASVKGTIEGDALVVEELRVIVGRLIDTIKDEVYHNSIENCHRWLMCAEQQYPILLSEKSKYTQSYVAREYLTYVDTENKTHFYLSPAYPMLYATFASLLMEKFSNTSHAIARSAVVQGLVFEHKFLHHPGLRGDLNVTTVTKDNIIHKFTFNLSTLSPPQCNTALQQLSLSCLHHLRPGHPAIDAVCLTTNSANPADENYYLLLMQVSLSKYSDHRSKAIDIRKVVVAPEKDVAPNPNLSVAEFYRSLAKQENVKIVYIYASPQQLKEPSPKDFVDELADKNLRSGTDCPDYYYGFVDHDSMAGCMLKQLQEVTL